MKGRSSGFRSGDAWSICDRCGFAYRQSQLKKEWTGLMVCEKDWEPRHPQDFVKGFSDSAKPGPNSRPEPTDEFSDPGYLNYQSQDAIWKVATDTTGTMTQTGDSLEKTAGGSAWDTWAYITQGGSDIIAVEAVFESLTGTLWSFGSFGLKENKTYTPSSNMISLQAYNVTFGENTILARNGTTTLVTQDITSLGGNDVTVRVEYDGVGTVCWYYNGICFYTQTGQTITDTMFGTLTFFSAGQSVYDARVYLENNNIEGTFGGDI